ncbi:MAG: DNA alkylation repair protein [Bacteroidales bacterium]|nr:DNA alkylation repair protein [Bacteroidales bacterium]
MYSEKDIIEFQKILQKNSSIQTKEWWEKYLKHIISFRGIGIPEIRKLLKTWYTKHKFQEEDTEDQINLAKEFFASPIAEDKLTGILILQEFLLDKITCEKMVCSVEDIFNRNYINDWNTCDWLSVKVLTPVIEYGRLVCVQQISNWKSSRRLWKARASAVAFAQAKNKLQYIDFIDEICSTLIIREERFAKTAVAWVLRETAISNPEYTLHFVGRYNIFFTKETIYNALKYFGPEIRQEYLKRLKIAL